MRIWPRWIKAGAMCAVAAWSVGTRLAAQDPAAPEAPVCGAGDLRLTLHGSGGGFAGMSHNGTLLALVNVGPSACRVGPFPTISLLDATGPLPIRFVADGAKFLHPGPVVFPVLLAPGAKATSTLRWVDGPVYGKNYCVTPRTLVATVQGKALSAAFGMQICGEQGKDVQPTMTRLQVDVGASPTRP